MNLNLIIKRKTLKSRDSALPLTSDFYKYYILQVVILSDCTVKPV